MEEQVAAIPKEKYEYEICIRTQHAKRGRSGWHGPDGYVAVVRRPAGAPRWDRRQLQRKALAKRGYAIRYAGEFYNRSIGPRSRFRAAIERAKEMILEWHEEGREEA